MAEIRENSDIKDVAIIGAGPVGLFAVFECGAVCCLAEAKKSLKMQSNTCAHAAAIAG